MSWVSKGLVGFQKSVDNDNACFGRESGRYPHLFIPLSQSFPLKDHFLNDRENIAQIRKFRREGTALPASITLGTGVSNHDE